MLLFVGLWVRMSNNLYQQNKNRCIARIVAGHEVITIYYFEERADTQSGR